MKGKHIRSGEFLHSLGRVIEQRLQGAGIAADAAAALSEDCKATVRQVFAGSKVYIPSAARGARVTAAKVHALCGAGVSVRDAAARLGLSLGYTYRLRSRPGAPKGQQR